MTRPSPDPDDVALSRKIILVMVLVLFALLGALAWGPLFGR